MGVRVISGWFGYGRVELILAYVLQVIHSVRSTGFLWLKQPLKKAQPLGLHQAAVSQFDKEYVIILLHL